jgi:hypothetical protein
MRQLKSSVHWAAMTVHALWLVEHACDALRHAEAAHPTPSSAPPPEAPAHVPVSSVVTTSTKSESALIASALASVSTDTPPHPCGNPSAPWVK